MQKLYNKLKKYTLEDTIKIEESDRQFIALKKLLKNINNKKIYLALIIANSIICYQLSGKGEDYWEEFCEYFKDHSLTLPLSGEGIATKLSDFVRQSKNNKRFIDTKINRLEKLKPFLNEFIGKEEKYYNDMVKLRDDLAKTMKQKIDAKTIVFAVKMFSYGARNIFDKLIIFPDLISLPIDSRLIKLYEKYGPHPTPLPEGEGIKQSEIKKFYFELSKKLSIPELHLDAILWVNYEKLIK